MIFDALFEIMSDEETMKHYPSPFDKERTRGWITWNIENYSKYGFGLWAVVLKETNVGSYSTAIANGMKKIKEYLDPKNEISYIFNNKRGMA